MVGWAGMKTQRPPSVDWLLTSDPVSKEELDILWGMRVRKMLEDKGRRLPVSRPVSGN